jgi:hypothetical protein
MDRAEAHQVSRDAGLHHAGERKEHGQGDGGGHDGAALQAAEQQEQNRDDHESAFDQVPGHGPDRPPDEIGPVAVFYGISAWFGRGWFGSYPPLHYYLLSVLYAPFWMLSAVANAPAEMYPPLVWVNRLASVQMAAATLVVVYALARGAAPSQA